MSIAHVVHGQNSTTGIIAERVTQRDAPASLASVRLESREELLRHLGREVLLRALCESADIAVAVHLLSWSGRAATGVGERSGDDILHSAFVTEGTSFAVEAKGAGLDVGNLG